ncbi:methyltransferase domain-containing protein [Leucobacter sp. USHLN153]|uniref:methyltransferase domain-containing protein n=1 Tax=Leucobacter sp. USHLN153 TaxID=3081268 RepID=UPI0030183316
MSGVSRVSLARRDAELRELMDDPDCDPERLRRTLERFDLVNRAVSSWGRVYRTHVRPALSAARAESAARVESARASDSPALRPLRILDLGCGGGDVLRRIVRRARRDGFDVEGLGIDPDPRSLAVARVTRPIAGVEYRECMSRDLVAEGARFDVVISNHVLHHLGDADRAAWFAESEKLADRLAVHSDIARGRLAYAGFAIGIAPLAPGSLLRVDGLRSIRRSFTVGEIAAELPEGWRAERVGPFRLLAVYRAQVSRD